MKKDNQMARIEQFIGQLQTPESKDAVILLDSKWILKEAQMTRQMTSKIA